MTEQVVIKCPHCKGIILLRLDEVKEDDEEGEGEPGVA